MLDDRPLPAAEAKAKAEAAPRDARLRAAHALALLHERKADEAQAVLDAALALDPREPTALYLSARLALAHKDAAKAQVRLDGLASARVDGYAVQVLVAEVAEARKDKVAMRRALEAAARFDPTQPEPVKGLFALAEEEKRAADAVNLLARWAMLDQHDRRVWRKLLGRLVEARRWEEAARTGEAASTSTSERGGSPRLRAGAGRAGATSGGGLRAGDGDALRRAAERAGDGPRAPRGRAARRERRDRGQGGARRGAPARPDERRSEGADASLERFSVAWNATGCAGPSGSENRSSHE